MKVTLDIPDRVYISKIILKQIPDSCQNDEGPDQELIVKISDAGGGAFPIVSTKYWSYCHSDETFVDGISKELCVLYDIVEKQRSYHKEVHRDIDLV